MASSEVFFTSSTKLKNKYIYLDNDFLGKLFHDEDFYRKATFILSESHLIIEPLIQFEFLRDVYLPEQYQLRQSFLSREIFLPALTKHPEIFSKTLENALLLSQLYAHQGKDIKSSFVDLQMGARLMLEPGSILITGNKKHFPSFIFDTISIITLEQGDGNLQSYAAIGFNDKKFNHAYTKFDKIRQ